jgi:hypothetical protein
MILETNDPDRVVLDSFGLVLHVSTPELCDRMIAARSQYSSVRWVDRKTKDRVIELLPI